MFFLEIKAIISGLRSDVVSKKADAIDTTKAFIEI